MNARDIVIQSAINKGIDPAVALSLWEQESNSSADLALRGATLPQGHKYAGHYARGPWQIMSFHGDIPDTFEGQTNWAMQHLKDRGVAGYYGQTGGGGTQSPTGLSGHPSTNDYVSQIMARAQGIPTGGGASADPAQVMGRAADQALGLPGTTADDPRMYTNGVRNMNGLLDGGQQSGGLLGGQSRAMGLLSNPFIQLGIGMMGAPSIGAGLQQGMGNLARGEQMRFEQEMSQAKFNNMSPYQKAQIEMRQQEMGQRQERAQQQQAQAKEQAGKLQEARAIAAAQESNPQRARLIMLGMLDDQIGGGGEQTSAIQNYEYLVGQGVEPERAREQAFKSGVTINNAPKIPSGYRLVDPAQPSGDVEPIPGSKDAVSRDRKTRSTQSSLAAIDKLQELVRGRGEGLDLVGDAGTQIVMGSLYDEIMTQIGQLADAGVLQVGDIERLRKSLPDPREKFTFASKKDIIGGLDAVRSRIENITGVSAVPDVPDGWSVRRK